MAEHENQPDPYGDLRAGLVDLLPGSDHADEDSELLQAVAKLLEPEHFNVEGMVAGDEPIVVITRGVGTPLITMTPDGARSMGMRLIVQAKEAEFDADMQAHDERMASDEG